MILFTALLCRIILLLATMAAAVYLLRRQMPVKRAAVLACLLVPLAAAANHVSGLTPSLTDEVSLLALNEKSGTSQGYEIVIDGFRVDGRDCPVDGVADGKWFWRGEQYMWRPETDPRQPEGVTRQVTVKVPAGWDRKILFSANEYRGAVEVTTANGTVRIDTAETAAVTIGRSSTRMLIAEQAVRLAVYGIVLLVAAAYMLLCIRSLCKYSLEGSSSGLFYAGLVGVCGVSFIIMVVLGGKESFWRDEISLIGYICNTDSVLTAMKTDIAWPPLWKGIMFIWYRLVPYGERWLRLPAELCAVGGIWFVGLSGKKIGNQRTGMIAALLTAFAVVPQKRIAQDITCYGLVFLLAAVVTYLYLRRTLSETEYSLRRQILFVAAMATAAYTHYFGFFLCGALFLVDCFEVIKKKLPIKRLIPYVVTGALYLPWLYFVIFKQDGIHASYWQPKPALKDIPGFLRTLTGGLPILFHFFLLGITIAVIQVIFSTGLKKEASHHPVNICPPGFIISVPATMFVCVFLYGKYIAIGNTFWVKTYFFVLMPCILLLCTATVEMMYQYLRAVPGDYSRVLSSSVVILLMVVIGSASYSRKEAESTKTRDPYREPAEWVYSRGNDLYNPDELIIFAASSEVKRYAWIDYYITQRGKRDSLDVRGRFISKEELLAYDKIVWIWADDFGLGKDEPVMQWLSEFYTMTDTVQEVRATIYEKIT